MSDNICVLYIEDEADIREMTEFALEDEGFELIVCKSGSDALSKAPEIHPDLVLLDMMMPGMDGLTTMRKLRQFSHLCDVPVVFMTAKVQASEKEKYREMGAIGIISKPFNAMTLADDIRAMLEQST